MKILVTGDRGMVGKAFCNLARYHGHQVFESSRWGQYPLQDWFIHMLDQHKPTHVMHLAARVGGVGANLSQQADFAFENVRIADQVFDGMRWHRKRCLQEGKPVPKLCSVLSTCVYPTGRYVTYPMTEDQIHKGPPDPSNYGYAYGKRILDTLTLAHREQYGVDWITVAPCNVYGENDNFSLEGGHVLPALIHRFYLAHRDGLPEVQVWGTGQPLRQLVYVKDLARQLLGALEHYDDPMPLNLGTRQEHSISEVVHEVAQATGYPMNQVRWDTTKPDGQYRKPASLDRLESQRWYQKGRETSLRQGIKNVVRWFSAHYPNVRGVASLEA